MRLINSMAQATNPEANQYENFFLWLHGASLLAELKATEALDLLIANIDFTDGWSALISESHFGLQLSIVARKLKSADCGVDLIQSVA